MIYQWKTGAHISIDPQAAGEEMERIRVHRNGRLDQEAVVEAARSPDSALHDHFEWDDRKAANSFRLDQAGHLIRCITVEMPKRGGDDVPTRAFVSVVRDGDRSYTSTAHALSDAELRQQVLDTAWRELEAWRQRHAELIELAEVFSVIDQARGA
jgi:hypothetical protein